MVYRHMVLHNGVIYPAGIDVPVEDKEKVVEKQPSPSTEDADTETKKKGNRPKK
ncbi:MAG: hypothetical protein Q4A15_08075 [Prevotellaceae bacterium]|nr:hypothetical protein [Prevotellaceae bacterium]